MSTRNLVETGLMPVVSTITALSAYRFRGIWGKIEYTFYSPHGNFFQFSVDFPLLLSYDALMETILVRANELLEELLHRQMLCRKVMQSGSDIPLYAWYNGHDRYYYTYVNNQQHYLGKKSPQIEKAQSFYCAKTIDAALEKNIAILKTMIEDWTPYNLFDLKETFTQAYQDLSIQLSETLEFIDPVAWATAPYSRSHSHPEHLIHQAKSGLYVRSRAEAFIADIYDSLNIPFRYEDELLLPNGHKWNPDFTLLIRGRIKWHEHCGNLKDPASLKRLLWKEQQCVMAGIQPGRDILFTFDGYEGELNTRYLRRSIEQFLENCD